ncbi:MAG TPA: iduronate sulfatase [Verrucomicrobiales bacterium]|nr:iduronate sulfatase [Verrucomicrobiales bacterium]
MNPRTIIFLSVLVAGHSAWAARPNVLFIAVDDFRPQLGCYGKTRVQSPNMDQLAVRGVLFDRAYCQYASCNPSRASLLTGLRPDSTGVFNNNTHFRKKAPDVITLPQQFKEHGYVTRSFGKIFHGAFATAYAGTAFHDPQAWSAPPWLGSPQYYFTPEGIEAARAVYARKFKKSGADLEGWKTEFVQALCTEAPDVPDNTLYDGQMTDRAIEALGDLKEKPFFLAVGYLKPHLPFVAPKKYWDLYDCGAFEMPNPANAPQDAPSVALPPWGELRGQYSDIPKQGPLTEAKTRELIHGYHACVSFVDAQIGRLLGELDRLGLRENTLIVLWGDHGWHLGELNHWAKQTAFELATRAPLIVSVPGRKAVGVKSAALVEFVDVYPTLCDLAELPKPAHLEGTSFAPLLDAPDRPWKTAAFSQVIRPGIMGRTMRTERYRFTQWSENKTPGKTLAVELYDYHSGSNEVENIAARPEHAALVKELSARLEAGWRSAQP